ncbi:hypothetical protein IJT93_02580 [bacterium]|nr:hypothetical protein [bacterium]
MKLSGSIKFSIYLSLGMHILVSYCLIWFFARMVPLISSIPENNEQSIDSAMCMMYVLAENEAGVIDVDTSRLRFERHLHAAEKFITEEREEDLLDVISKNYAAALGGDRTSFELVSRTVMDLKEINLIKAHNSIVSARHMGDAGAWGVFFLASLNFIISLMFLRTLQREWFLPIEEMAKAIDEYKKGNLMRRCNVFMHFKGKGMEKLMKDINELLDSGSDINRRG